MMRTHFHQELAQVVPQRAYSYRRRNEGVRTAIKAAIEKDMAQYEVAYWNEDLESQYRSSVKNDRPIGKHVRHGEIPLTPLMKDEFTSDS